MLVFCPCCVVVVDQKTSWKYGWRWDRDNLRYGSISYVVYVVLKKGWGTFFPQSSNKRRNMFFEVLPLCVPGTFSTGSFLCALMEVIPGLLLHSFKNVVNIHTILSSFFVSGLFTVTQHYCFLLLEIEREYKSISFQYCYDQHSMQKKKGRQIDQPPLYYSVLKILYSLMLILSTSVL